MSRRSAWRRAAPEKSSRAPLAKIASAITGGAISEIQRPATAPTAARRARRWRIS